MDFPALLSLLISCQCFLLLCNKIKQYFNKKRKATASEIKKKNTCTRGLSAADISKHRTIETRLFNAQLSCNNSDILPDPYRAHRKVLRKKNTMFLSWAGHAVRGQTDNNRSHPAKAAQICLQPETGSSWQTCPGKHDATLTPA